jgi:uncharacterized protein
MNDIIERVKNFVEEECKKPSSKYGYEPFVFHFHSVHKYAKELAEGKVSEGAGVDIEVVEVAAWLHDIGSIIRGRKDHHVTGSEIAEEKLREFGYPEDKIARVKHCIYAHRGSQKIPRESVEAQIIADADVMSHFDTIAGLFKAAFVYENLNQGDAIDSIRQKLTNSYGKLSSDAKEIIKPKYEAAMVLLVKNE